MPLRGASRALDSCLGVDSSRFQPGLIPPAKCSARLQSSPLSEAVLSLNDRVTEVFSSQLREVSIEATGGLEELPQLSRSVRKPMGKCSCTHTHSTPPPHTHMYTEEPGDTPAPSDVTPLDRKTHLTPHLSKHTPTHPHQRRGAVILPVFPCVNLPFFGAAFSSLLWKNQKIK